MTSSWNLLHSVGRNIVRTAAPPSLTETFHLLLVLPTLKTRLAQRPKSPGSPTLIFIAGAALRVADVTRVLKDKKFRGDKGGDVAKLFARHFKLEEHVTYMKRTKLASLMPLLVQTLSAAHLLAGAQSLVLSTDIEDPWFT